MRTTILIADDLSFMRMIEKEILVERGYAVVGEAVDGADALVAAHDLRPDVVLLDVQLPGDDGFAVAETLVAHPPAPAVVLVSSRARSDYGPRAARTVARGFIAKDELSGDALRRVLEG
jgi:DNA-binding NarL/FixJ family response regulator